MNEEKCPRCPNHCDRNDLGCGRGREYFGTQNREKYSKDNYSNEPRTLNEQVIMDLRKCGHLLHHNRDLDVDQFLSVYSENELNRLHELLSKITEK